LPSEHQITGCSHPEKVSELRKWMVENVALMKDFQDFGTGAAMAGFVTIGNLPVNNFRDGLFPM